jgi:DNA polymerase-4
MSRVKTEGIKDTIADIEDKTIRELKFTIMYVDLNSCFATTEQQARPKLRNKPVAILNRLTENSAIIAASIEAKALGIKVGMRANEAKDICKDIVFAETEPSKYIYVHEKLKSILKSYSPKVLMKSIDEGLVDLSEASEEVRSMTPRELASEIKERLRTEVGCYMKCNVGFSYNRFLAKLAGELHKPDGLDCITNDNIREVFSHLKLTDLPGINKKTEKRLKVYGIDNPLKLLDAKEETLRIQVLGSVEGTKWYYRLRGVETDERDEQTKSIGRQFVLAPNTKLDEVKIRLAHLAEDVGFRLRSQDLHARGIYVWVTFNLSENNFTSHKNFLKDHTFNTDLEIIEYSKQLFEDIIKVNANKSNNPRIIGVSLYKLETEPTKQLAFGYEKNEKAAKVAEVVDAINNRFGSRTVHSAYTLKSNDMHTKIPFGSTRYLDKNIGK